MVGGVRPEDFLVGFERQDDLEGLPCRGGRQFIGCRWGRKSLDFPPFLSGGGSPVLVPFEQKSFLVLFERKNFLVVFEWQDDWVAPSKVLLRWRRNGQGFPSFFIFLIAFKRRERKRFLVVFEQWEMLDRQ